MQERIKYLFQKYLDSTATPEEVDEIFSALEKSESVNPLEEILDQQLGSASVGAPIVKKIRARYAVAASFVAIALAATAWFLLKPSAAMQSMTIADKTTVTRATQRSEFKYLLLPDSTQVWLNAASTLEFPEHFGNKSREVRLKGEAYFDVKHADKIPFIIYSGDVITQVLGTAFNIKAYPDLEKITVSVQRGKVKVKYKDRDVAVLMRGEQAVIGNKDQLVKATPVKSPDSAPWHEGNLAYDDYSIGDIVADLQRVYDIRINVQSPDIAAMRVSTSFRRAQGVDAALDILCRLSDAHIVQANGIYNMINAKK